MSIITEDRPTTTIDTAFRVEGPWLIDTDTNFPVAARCRRCNTVTEMDELSTHSRMRYGKEALCKGCHVLNVQDRHDALRARQLEQIINDAATIRHTGYKECSHCRTELPLTEFHPASREVDGTAYYCAPCASILAVSK